MNELAYTVLAGIVSFALVWFWFDVWIPFRVSWLRQQLFDIRGRLFEDAEQLKLFSTPAYGMVRTTINGMIRFADDISVANFFTFVALLKLGRGPDGGSRYLAVLDRHMSSLSDAQRQALKRALGHAHLEILRHALVTSLVCISGYVVGVYLLRALNRLQAVSNRVMYEDDMRKQFARLDAEAQVIGESRQVMAVGTA